MGFAAVAGHVIILVALFSSGLLLAGAFNNSLSSQIDARHELEQRLKDAARAEYTLESHGYAPDNDRTYANFTNDGAREVNLDDVTVLVDGTVLDENAIQRFELREDASSRIWMPGETLEIMTQNRGDADLTIADLYGIAHHRRA